MPKIPPETMRYLTIGIEFIAIFMFFLAIGFFLDRAYDTAPVWTVIGMVVGFGGSMYRVIRMAKELDWGRKGPPDVEDD